MWCYVDSSVMLKHNLRLPSPGAAAVIIRVLGAGCSRCNKLFRLASQAVRETGVEARVERVEDLAEILSYDILMTPALVIDGAVQAAGRVPGLEELKDLLRAHSSPLRAPRSGRRERGRG